jgi:hypothetical protein
MVTLLSANRSAGVVTAHVRPPRAAGEAHTIGHDLATRILVAPHVATVNSA